MKRYLWVVALVVAIAVVAVLAGCGRGSIAEVNGKTITRDDFYNYMQARAGSQLLQQMLDDRLTLAMAEERGVAPTQEQVDKQFETFKKMADLDQVMKDRGLTPEQVKEELKVMVARQNMAEKAIGDKITDKEVREAYESQKAMRYDQPERVRAEIISFPNKEAADDAAKQIEDGATLEKIAEGDGEHSQIINQTIPKNGPGMPAELVKAAFDTSKGKTSKPVKLSFGGPGQEQWIILRAGERVPATKISFDEAEPMVRGELAMMKSNQDPDYQKQLREARKEAKIKVLVPSLKQVEKNFKQRT